MDRQTYLSRKTFNSSTKKNIASNSKNSSSKGESKFFGNSKNNKSNKK